MQVYSENLNSSVAGMLNALTPIFTFIIGLTLFNKSSWKKENIIQIEKRLTGWQLESFKESYSYKIKNGMSLFKKNLIKE